MACVDQKKALDALGLELEIIVSCREGAGSWTQALCKSTWCP